MISETTFCTNYSSLWKMLAPTCDVLVRRLNSGAYDRFDVPINSKTDPARRAFVNEVAFTLFDDAIKKRKGGVSPVASLEERANACELAHEMVKRLGDARSNSEEEPNKDEWSDIDEQFRRLWTMLTVAARADQIVVRPEFKGCGIVDTCSGDVVLPGTLYEIKAGDRNIRSIDIRQLITYCALNSASGQYSFSKVGLLNPRVGISFVLPIDQLCFEISGKSAALLFAEVVQVISSGDVSR